MDTAIKIQKATTTKLTQAILDNPLFGHYFTDHMLEVDFLDGHWQTPHIKPFQNLSLSPGTTVLHYAQTIFEGIKAFKHSDGQVFVFRPHENYKRFCISAERMQMPKVPESIFIEGMRQLIEVDKNWIPPTRGMSLYIRPFMFATNPIIGVRSSTMYKLLILLSPAGIPYNKPQKIFVEQRYTRAAKGGVGYAKTGGNYAAAMQPTLEANEKGYDQILWTDSETHQYAQEIGTMNVFFVIGNTVVTPETESGSVLLGVTRKSAIELLKDMGYQVEERAISLDELKQAYRDGRFTEMFGTGTYASVYSTQQLDLHDYSMVFDTNKQPVTNALLKKLTDIQFGHVPDTKSWLLKV